MKIFLLVVIFFLNGLTYGKCNGDIDEQIPDGIVLKLKNIQKDKQCWTSFKDYIVV